MQIGSRDVEEMLAAGHGILPDRRVAFRGRLEHLRKLDCPSGVKTGKGRAAVFRWPQVIELALALDLMNLGITPEHASRGIKAVQVELATSLYRLCSGPESYKAIVAAVQQQRWPLETSIFLTVNIGALSSLKSDGAVDAPLINFVDGGSLSSHLDQASWYEAAMVLVNLGSRIAQIIYLLCAWIKLDEVAIIEDLIVWVTDANFEEINKITKILDENNVSS